MPRVDVGLSLDKTVRAKTGAYGLGRQGFIKSLLVEHLVSISRRESRAMLSTGERMATSFVFKYRLPYGSRSQFSEQSITYTLPVDWKRSTGHTSFSSQDRPVCYVCGYGTAEPNIAVTLPKDRSPSSAKLLPGDPWSFTAPSAFCLADGVTIASDTVRYITNHVLEVTCSVIWDICVGLPLSTQFLVLCLFGRWKWGFSKSNT